MSFWPIPNGLLFSQGFYGRMPLDRQLDVLRDGDALKPGGRYLCLLV